MARSILSLIFILYKIQPHQVHKVTIIAVHASMINMANSQIVCWYYGAIPPLYFANNNNNQSPISCLFLFVDHQLQEHSIDKYLHDIPSNDLVRLGLELGLKYDRLKRLESVQSGNFCLDLISSWLREVDDVSERSGKPSWESLANALEEIGQNGIAKKVRDCRCQ